jgi:hypothetical protein
LIVLACCHLALSTGVYRRSELAASTAALRRAIGVAKTCRLANPIKKIRHSVFIFFDQDHGARDARAIGCVQYVPPQNCGGAGPPQQHSAASRAVALAAVGVSHRMEIDGEAGDAWRADIPGGGLRSYFDPDQNRFRIERLTETIAVV